MTVVWSGCCSQVKTRNRTLNWLYTFEVLEYITTDVPKTKPQIFKTFEAVSGLKPLCCIVLMTQIKSYKVSVLLRGFNVENNYWESIRCHSWESDHLDSNASQSSQSS